MTSEIQALGHALGEVGKGRLLAVLTGAGISAESGLPTFRGAGGLWEGQRAEDLATPEAFSRDPVRVWRFYEWRRGLVRDARPNAGHEALARLERLLPRMTLVTQNVDGLHQAAGSKAPVELHGSVLRVRCAREGTVRPAPAASYAELPPRCAACGGVLRPDVVWFGEALPVTEWAKAVAAAQECAVFLVVGTSSVVAPASTLAVMAARSGARVFEVNPEETPLSPLAEGVFRLPASTLLPKLVEVLEGTPA